MARRGFAASRRPCCTSLASESSKCLSLFPFLSLALTHSAARNETRVDQIVDADRSQTLVDACAHSRIETHESGHVVPTQAPWRNFLRDYIHAFADETHEAGAWRHVQGPNERPRGQVLANGESPLPSGTNTPREQEEQDVTKRKPSL